MKYQAFISCDPKDRDLAYAVKTALNDAGLTCVGYEDLPQGDDYQKALVTAIEDSKTLIFIPPAGYGADSTIHSEVETAVKLKRTVIPYYRERTTLDDSLSFLTQTSEPIWADEGDVALQKAVEAVHAAKEPPKKHKKTVLIISAIAAVVLIAVGALLFVLLRREPAPTATGQDGENTWSYYEGSGKLVVSGEGKGKDYDYMEGISDGEKVPWYEYRESIKTVIVEEGVKQLGWGTINNMPNLESVTLPGTLETVSSSTLYLCPKITEVAIPEGVTVINSGAFSNCESLSKINIPSSANQITGAPCQMCFNLTDIEISADNANYKVVDGVLYSADMIELVQYPVGSDAKTFTMPDTVETLGFGALSCAEKLEQITFSENLRTVGQFAVSDVGISEAILPAGVTEIGMSAFTGCGNLSRVELPDGLKQIEMFAFYHCPALKEITVPASVDEIGDLAFGYGENESGEIEISNIVISGKAGSAADTYSQKYNIIFNPID